MKILDAMHRLPRWSGSSSSRGSRENAWGHLPRRQRCSDVPGGSLTRRETVPAGKETWNNWVSFYLSVLCRQNRAGCATGHDRSAMMTHMLAAQNGEVIFVDQRDFADSGCHHRRRRITVMSRRGRDLVFERIQILYFCREAGYALSSAGISRCVVPMGGIPSSESLTLRASPWRVNGFSSICSE